MGTDVYQIKYIFLVLNSIIYDYDSVIISLYNALIKQTSIENENFCRLRGKEQAVPTIDTA